MSKSSRTRKPTPVKPLPSRRIVRAAKWVAILSAVMLVVTLTLPYISA